MPLLIRIETLDDYHRPDVIHVNPEHVIKIYQKPISGGGIGSIICLDTRSHNSVSKLLTRTALTSLLADLGPFVSVTPADSREPVEYVRAQSIVLVKTHDYFKPVAERTEGWLHLKDGSMMLVSDIAGVTEQIQAIA